MQPRFRAGCGGLPACGCGQTLDTGNPQVRWLLRESSKSVGALGRARNRWRLRASSKTDGASGRARCGFSESRQVNWSTGDSKHWRCNSKKKPGLELLRSPASWQVQPCIEKGLVGLGPIQVHLSKTQLESHTLHTVMWLKLLDLPSSFRF